MRFGEDIDFSYRLVESGARVRLFPDAWVWHKRRTDLRKFYRQVYNSGIARINLEKRHPGTMKLVHLLPMIFTLGVVALLLTALSGLIWLAATGNQAALWVTLLPLLPLVLYSLLICLDSCARHHSLKIGGISVAAAFVQLMGYGCGFLESWWKRCVLGKDEFQAFEKTFYK